MKKYILGVITGVCGAAAVCFISELLRPADDKVNTDDEDIDWDWFDSLPDDDCDEDVDNKNNDSSESNK